MTQRVLVVDVATGKIVSAEALIRWNHHSFGMLAPYKFIPAFEENGDISKITRFMVDSVIAFNEDRKSRGLTPVPCAVNLSRIDFYNPKLVNYLIDKFEKTSGVTDMIKVEVTESAYAVLEADGIRLLNKIHDMGIKILLDDYGSGKSFAFDTIKLDMGFIRKIGTSHTAEAIIRSTIDMAHKPAPRKAFLNPRFTRYSSLCLSIGRSLSGTLMPFSIAISASFIRSLCLRIR